MATTGGIDAEVHRSAAWLPPWCDRPRRDDDPGPSTELDDPGPSSEHGTRTGSHKKYYVFNHLVLNILVVQMHEGHAPAADSQVLPL